MARSAMKIGTAPISWGVCELPDWGVVLPYQRVLDEMAELGFAEGANEIASRAKEVGLITAFHPHAGTYVETPREIDELMRRTDASLVGLCLDTGHIFYGGGDPVAIARRDPKRIRHVHLKDVSRERYQHALARELDFTAAVGEDVFVPVGEGAVDMQSVIGTLRDAGFDGWLIVEQDIRIVPGSSRQPKIDAAKSYTFITAQLR